MWLSWVKSNDKVVLLRRVLVLWQLGKKRKTNHWWRKWIYWLLSRATGRICLKSDDSKEYRLLNQTCFYIIHSKAERDAFNFYSPDFISIWKHSPNQLLMGFFPYFHVSLWAASNILIISNLVLILNKKRQCLHNSLEKGTEARSEHWTPSL